MPAIRTKASRRRASGAATRGRKRSTKRTPAKRASALRSVASLQQFVDEAGSAAGSDDDMEAKLSTVVAVRRTAFSNYAVELTTVRSSVRSIVRRKSQRTTPTCPCHKRAAFVPLPRLTAMLIRPFVQGRLQVVALAANPAHFAAEKWPSQAAA